MTDMRATERLLEVIDELATAQLDEGMHPVSDDRRIQEIISAARELRRRGDTLVRRDDLRRVMEYDDESSTSEEHGRYIDACNRLEIALGGKLR